MRNGLALNVTAVRCIIVDKRLRTIDEPGHQSNSVTISESLEQLECVLFDRRGDCPCVNSLTSSETHPLESTHEGFSFAKALGGVSQPTSGEKAESPLEAIEQGLAQAKLLIGSQPCPILAVAGLLNAGKTSLVGGFLSAEGRARLLIGQANQQGTHRFVLWLPESWRNHSSLWSAMLKQLEAIFGGATEALSDEPSLAFRQYNGECLMIQADAMHSPMSIPLIATDPALDRWGIGLMDCPDIQTGIASGSVRNDPPEDQTVAEATTAFAASRSRMLERGLRIASAFVVVTSANAIRDTSVDMILQAAVAAKPGLKILLAVNRVPRRYTAQEIADEIAEGYRNYALWRVYMAYHYEGPHQRERIPRFPSSFPLSTDTVPSPIFFRIDRSPPIQPPASVSMDDFLVSLGGQLDRSELVRELTRSTLLALHQRCCDGWSTIQAYSSASQQRMHRLHQTIAHAGLSLLLDESASPPAGAAPALRLQVSREIVSQIAQSLERTAPWWALPGRQMARWSEQLRHMTSGVARWVMVPRWISSRVQSTSQWVRSRWRSGDGGRIITATSYRDAIQDCDFHQDLVPRHASSPSDLWTKTKEIIERFQSESRTRLKEEQLDAYTRETWNQMTWRQRLWTGVAPAGLLFAPLLAVVMLPLDFGGTSVLVCASMKELLFAGMASVGMAMIKSDQMPQIAEQEAAWQQLSDLFALTCDRLAIPRPLAQAYPEVQLGGTKKRLLASAIPVRLANDGNSSSLSFIAPHPAFAARLDEALANLAVAASLEN